MLFFACLHVMVNAQETDIANIPSELTERPWLDQSRHQLYGNTITQVFGEREAVQRHSNLGPITSMAYKSLSQLIEDVNEKDISEEEKSSLIRNYKENAAGGLIELFLARSSESRANFKWFFIVIRGADDNDKIMEIDLDYQAPQLPDANGWWNYTTILLPKNTGIPFYVYVNDKQSQYLSDFKFKVE